MKKIIIGNWKMNPAEVGEAEVIFKEILAGFTNSGRVKAVICPPAPFIERLFLLSKQRITIGAEDCFWGEAGSYTGEVSARMLKSVGVRYVIIGHSERRALGDSDQLINKKIRSALDARLKVVFCVGERVRDELGEYLNFIRNQLVTGLDRTKKDLLNNLLIAYEPIWAIGKDAIRPASPADVLEVSIFIKKVLAEMFGYEVGVKVPIIYGGSVDHKNSSEFLRVGNVVGLLVGRESLLAENFVKILKVANDL